MNIYKRGSVYWVRFMRNGREFRISCKTGDRKTARAFAEGLRMVRKAAGREDALKLVDIFFPPETGGSVRLADLWDTYLRTAESVGVLPSADSIRRRKEVLAKFCKWCPPTISEARHVTGAIAAKYAALLANSRNRKGAPLSAKTRRNHLAELAAVWKIVGKVDPFLGEPWGNLAPRAAPGEANRREAFTREQEQAVFAAAARIGKGWPLACLLARWTGLRYGDIATLTWGEIDASRAILTRVPNKTARHGVKVVIPLAAPLAAALAKDGEHGPGEFVLPNHAAVYGSHSQSAYQRLNFREVLNAAGLGENYTFHSWRHTFRSRLAEGGVAKDIAMRLCGHTREETSDHYDHSSHIGELFAAIEAAK